MKALSSLTVRVGSRKAGEGERVGLGASDSDRGLEGDDLGWDKSIIAAEVPGSTDIVPRIAPLGNRRGAGLRAFNCGQTRIVGTRSGRVSTSWLDGQNLEVQKTSICLSTLQAFVFGGWRPRGFELLLELVTSITWY